MLDLHMADCIQELIYYARKVIMSWWQINLRLDLYVPFLPCEGFYLCSIFNLIRLQS